MRPKLNLQSLEAREVPAAFVPDPSFSTAGVSNIATGGPNFTTVHIADVETLPGGGLLAVGVREVRTWLPESVSSTSTTELFLARMTADGQLDPAFDGDGVATPAGVADGSYVSVSGADVQADGKILLAGYFGGGGGLVRLTADGQPDPTFGAGGFVHLAGSTYESFSGYETGLAVRALADGKIVAVTAGIPGLGGGTAYRLNADGSPDATYGANGVGPKFKPPAEPSDGRSWFNPEKAVIAADGTVVVAGTATASPDSTGLDRWRNTTYVGRVTADGTLDTTFGDGGFATVPGLETGYAVAGLAVRPDGSVVLGLRSYGGYVSGLGQTSEAPAEHALVQLTPAGVPDAAFGTDGRAVIASSDRGVGFLPYFNGLGLTPAGDIAVLFGRYEGLAVGLYRADGSGYAAEPSRVVGGDPQAFYSYGDGSSFSNGSGLVIDPAGRVLIGPVFEQLGDFLAGTSVSRIRVARAVLDPDAVAFDPVPELPELPGGPFVPIADPLPIVEPIYIDAGPVNPPVDEGFVAPTAPVRSVTVAPLFAAASGSNVVVTLSGGRTATLTPFADFAGPVSFAVGDVTGDGVADLVAAAGAGGGAVVAVFDGAKLAAGQTAGAEVAHFFGIPDADFRGGATVALADVTGDGVADIVTAAGGGGGPRVTVWDGTKLGSGAAPVADFFAFEEGQRGGVNVAAGTVGADGRVSLVFGAGAGGGPRVRVADAFSVVGVASLDAAKPTADFFAGDPEARSGADVGVYVAGDYGPETPFYLQKGSLVANAPGSPRRVFRDLRAPVGEPLGEV